MLNIDKKSDQMSFYSFKPPGSTPKTCFRCGKEGHIQFDCQEPAEAKQRKPCSKPQLKRFCCALHKDDLTKNCWSASCEELSKMSDVKKRPQLLIENRDCQHCR